MWAVASQITSRPGRVWRWSAIWLPIVPEGTKSAASRSRVAAASASRRATVGSSPQTSSPTSASAIARRIAASGRVTVSERRSIVVRVVAFMRFPSSKPERHAHRQLRGLPALDLGGDLRDQQAQPDAGVGDRLDVVVREVRERPRAVEARAARDEPGADVRGHDRKPLAREDLDAPLGEVEAVAALHARAGDAQGHGGREGAALDERPLDLRRAELQIGADRLADRNAEVDAARQTLAHSGAGDREEAAVQIAVDRAAEERLLVELLVVRGLAVDLEADHAERPGRMARIGVSGRGEAAREIGEVRLRGVAPHVPRGGRRGGGKGESEEDDRGRE